MIMFLNVAFGTADYYTPLQWLGDYVINEIASSFLGKYLDNIL